MYSSQTPDLSLPPKFPSSAPLKTPQKQPAGYCVRTEEGHRPRGERRVRGFRKRVTFEPRLVRIPGRAIKIRARLEKPATCARTCSVVRTTCGTSASAARSQDICSSKRRKEEGPEVGEGTKMHRSGCDQQNPMFRSLGFLLKMLEGDYRTMSQKTDDISKFALYKRSTAAVQKEGFTGAQEQCRETSQEAMRVTLCKREPPTTEDQQVRAGVCVEEKGGSSSCCCSVE